MQTWDDEKSVNYLFLLLVRHGQNNYFFGRTKLEKIRYFSDSTQNQRCFNVDFYRWMKVDKSTLTQRGYHVDQRRYAISTYINVESTLSVCWVYFCFIFAFQGQERVLQVELVSWDRMFSLQIKLASRDWLFDLQIELLPEGCNCLG